MASETTITTREIPDDGVVLKSAPLTNAELDYNFIALNNIKLAASENLGDLTDIAKARENLELEVGSDVQPYDAQTARYYDTIANFTGDLQVSGESVLSGSDIGQTVQAYNDQIVTFDSATPVFTSTGALGVPVGTAQDRPDPASGGYIRYNEDTDVFEGYYSSSNDWGTIGSPEVLEDDDSTESYQIAFVDQTSGELRQVFISSGDFLYDAPSGVVLASGFDASSDFQIGGDPVINANRELTLASADFSEGTGSITLPSGTTSERPSSPKPGDVRHNTDLGEFETYNGSNWKIMSPTVQKATLTRTFEPSETVTINLNESVFTPIVGVTKEVPQTSLTSSDWEVSSSSEDEYKLHDTAYNTSITPSNSTGDGVFTLGSGGFRDEDVGKRVVGNGGEAVILSTDGEYTLIEAFDDSSSIPDGSWSLFDLTFDPTDGIKFETASEFADLSNSTFTRSFAVRSGDPEGLAFSRDGTRMYVASDDDGLVEYTLNVPWNLESAFYSGGFDPGARESVFISDDGTQLFGMDLGGNITEYSLSTAFDINTASSVRDRSFNAHESFIFADSGSRLYTTDYGSVITQYTLSTPWNIGTASSSGSFDVGSQDSVIADFYIDQNNGTRMIVLGDSSDTVYEYELSTPYDITSASYTGDFYVLPSQGSSMEGVFLSDEGSLYVLTNGPDAVYQYTLGAESNVVVAKYSSAITTAEARIDTEYWSDINDMSVIESVEDGDVYYAVSTDEKNSFDIVLNNEGTRKIVRNNAGVWEINTNEVYGSVTWEPALANGIHYALQEAMDYPVNQMDGAQLEGAGDDDYFTLTDTIDLGVVLFLPETAAVSPSTKGVNINYDGNVKNEGAILGTDYEYEHPDSTTVLFTNLSNETENLKIRVV